MRYVSRLYTFEQLSSEERCTACGAASFRLRAPPLAAGAHTAHLEGRMPDVHLCRECVSEFERAQKLGRPKLIAAMVLPPALVAMAGALTPFGVPWELPVFGTLALGIGWVLVRSTAKQRGRVTPAMYLDGAGTDVLLQLRTTSEHASAHYRERSVDADSEDQPASPRPMKLSIGMPALGIVALTLVLLWLGTFGAYPTIYLDAPGDADAVLLDGKPFVVNGRGDFRRRRVSWGEHTLSVGGEATQFRVHFGRNALITTDVARCYDDGAGSFGGFDDPLGTRTKPRFEIFRLRDDAVRPTGVPCVRSRW